MGTQLADRFNAKWTPEPWSGCWLWTGCVLQNGYGYLWPNKKAHRASWEIHCGAIPDKMCVLHKCDVKICVNPDHLFIGTNSDNLLDASAKGRLPMGRDNSSSKLTVEAVREIRNSSDPLRKLAVRFGVTHRAIRLAKIGETWRHVE